jgi:hypothetical protein
MEIRLLIKFGQEEHIKRLQQGHFYCKDIKYFTELEDGKARGDEFEAVIELKYLENGTLRLKPAQDANAPSKNLKVKDLLTKKHFHNPLGNLFCMSSLRVEVFNEPTMYTIDRRFDSFGTHFLLITNQIDFNERLQNGLKNLEINYEHGLVQYLDLYKYTGEKNLFQKDNQYAWQEEYRIYFHSGKAVPFEFSIGSIEDISDVYELSNNASFWLNNAGPGLTI